MWKYTEHGIWLKIKFRCNNNNDPNYRHYGGRGISVCKKWQDSFSDFLNDVGRRPTIKHTLDRIDNNGN